MNILLFLFLIILAAADTSLFPNLFGPNIHPSALLCAVIIWSARVGFERTWLMSALAGFLADIFSWGIIGPGIFIFTFISALTGSLAKRFLPLRKSRQLLTIYIFIALGTAVEYALHGIFARTIQFSAIDLEYLGLRIISNILISTLMLWPISKLYPNGEKGYKVAIK